MTNTYHTPYGPAGPLTHSAMDAPLGQLDVAIGTEAGARLGGDAALQAAINAVVLAGSGVTTTLNGSAASGQRVIPLASTTGINPGATAFMTDGTNSEAVIVASVSAGVSVTAASNLAHTYASGTIFSLSDAEIALARAPQPTLAARIAALGYALPPSNGSDDTAVINAALTLMNAGGGGRVVVPLGIYLVTSVIHKPGVILAGMGYGSVIKIKDNANSASAVAIDMDDANNATVRDLRIDGNLANQTEPGGAYTWGFGIGTPNTSANDCLIESVWVSNTLRTGIYMVGARNKAIKNTVTNCGKTAGVGRSGIVFGSTTTGGDGLIAKNHILTTLEYGIKLYAGNDRTRIVDNVITTTTSIGIWCDNSPRARVRGNTVLNAGVASVLSGIQISSDNTSIVSGVGVSGRVSVIDNVVIGAGANGIIVWNKSGTIDHCKVIGNDVFGSVYDGIAIVGSTGSVVTDNTNVGNATNVGGAETNHSGISLSASPNSIVTNNVCRSNGNATNGTGIFVLDVAGVSSSHSIITGNRCYDDGGGLQRYGIRLDVLPDYMTITDNDVTGNATGGMFFGGTPTNSKITNNIGSTKSTSSTGTGATVSGTTVVVTHGLIGTPGVVTISPTNSTGAGGAFYVSAKGATTFTITGINGGTFDWRASL